MSIKVLVLAFAGIHEALLDTQALVESVIVSDRPSVGVEILGLNTDFSGDGHDSGISAEDFLSFINFFGRQSGLDTNIELLDAVDFAKGVGCGRSILAVTTGKGKVVGERDVDFVGVAGDNVNKLNLSSSVEGLESGSVVQLAAARERKTERIEDSSFDGRNEERASKLDSLDGGSSCKVASHDERDSSDLLSSEGIKRVVVELQTGLSGSTRGIEGVRLCGRHHSEMRCASAIMQGLRGVAVDLLANEWELVCRRGDYCVTFAL